MLKYLAISKRVKKYLAKYWTYLLKWPNVEEIIKTSRHCVNNCEDSHLYVEYPKAYLTWCKVQQICAVLQHRPPTFTIFWGPFVLRSAYSALQVPQDLCLRFIFHIILRKRIGKKTNLKEENIFQTVVNLKNALWSKITTLESFVTWKYPILRL